MARIGNSDSLRRLARLRADSLDGLDNVHTLDNLAKDNVLAVEPRRLGGAQEKLRAVRVRASISHGQDARASVLQLEVLVSEFLAVNRLAAGAVLAREVTALAHEAWDHTVEW